MESLSTPSSIPNIYNMTKPKLVAAGALGMFIEALIPAIPFGILTSTVLIAAMVHQHHWDSNTAEINAKIHFSWIALLITGFATLLSIGLGLDILHGGVDATESDLIGWLPSTAWFLSILGILGTSISPQQTRPGSSWVHLVCDSTAHTIRQFFAGLIDCVQFRTHTKEDKEPIQLRGIFANIIMPIGAVGIFMILYGGINEAFEASTNVLFEWVGWLFMQWSTLVFMLPVSTLLLGAFILAVLIPAFTNPYKGLTGWVITTEDPVANDLDLLAEHLEEPKDSFKNQIDIATVTPTLMVLNTLLVWFHIVDLTTIISSDLSNAAVLSQNVHACLSRVLLATVASIGILMIPSNDQHNTRHQFWAKAWIVNNGVFSIWAIVKVGLYIALCGLTTKRIAILGAFIGLGLTVKACYTMFSKGKNATWIFNRAVELQYACIVGSSILATLVGVFKLF